MICRFPSTTVLSFPIACRLSRVRAFAIAPSVALILALSSFNCRALSVDL